MFKVQNLIWASILQEGKYFPRDI